ncbi:UDP-N-acetylmuramoyl-L-alanyl-D-glutamate--2,6-diaminopimelate ligase [Kushneria phosphatilytica]|uniref:UDP-N-acetylmuramoyl-L-alanyl-D-glutamate--2,6-diaminopimelate ligase n=1 Tax=Kushneria phosphatilytica TaxID=657387 RepID=A0A1S1NXX8_9GAMM|nr:UDP-N-acetylmuramoyl-L-alanyl-D-glutamate--2,6-diaminopimelate ligase [Kushneria phosphatilytica]OHV12226.1 UDP-N-acetylmuramoyl-L-alanyl-D-glutamate--2,6-diaminopimelate ligase [Kushneria phosphatilytica]QEL11426.1 UDP-N-acetylmuramoyl-L-alanyl-D-glutamate--2,6-diaminopimelate ligase [Kushneria phosphatilytica]
MTAVQTGSALERALVSLWPERTWPSLGPTARLRLDSRRVEPGDVFVAIPGTRVDGRDYILQALENGAELILAHAPWPLSDETIAVIEGLDAQLGRLAALACEVPCELEQIGVTGTNGKSSVTHYIAVLSELLDRPAGVIGTLGAGRPGKLGEAGLTTPDAIALQATLRRLADQGATRVALEASSHALDQQRLSGCRLRAAVFTNLSRDHLDYHRSMAAYAAAKARLFQREELELAVVNGDDPLSGLMLAGVGDGVRILRVGSNDNADFRIRSWHPHETGLHAEVVTPEGEWQLSLPLMGRFNLDNALLAAATLHGLGVPLAALETVLPQLTPVPGRMQRLSVPDSPVAVVDYAHTPDALEKALIALRPHARGQLWCLVGCGGDRDDGKRALMAACAERLADHVVITDDNPRSESPADIRRTMLEGLQNPDKALEIGDRRQAIHTVLSRAAPEDVVLIAGKGHETWQEIAGVRHPFSDLEVVNEFWHSASADERKQHG